MTGDDLHSSVVFVDLLNEAEQSLASRTRPVPHDDKRAPEDPTGARSGFPLLFQVVRALMRTIAYGPRWLDFVSSGCSNRNMQALAGWLIMFVGVALVTLSVAVLIRANAATRVSLWGRTVLTPGRSLALRACGAGMLVLGAALLGPTMSYWAAALVLASFLPGGLLIMRHNRKIAATAST